MKTRTDGTCEKCGMSLAGLAYEETHTRDGRDFCSYECLEMAQDGNFDRGNDFLAARN